MVTRTINQKRLIKSLRWHMRWDNFKNAEWNNALNMPIVRSMSGLRRLRLHIDRHMEATHYECAKSNNTFYESPWCEGLQKVSILPLAEVELVVDDPQCRWAIDSWKKIDRENFAEGLRNILLNPKGADIYAEA